MAGKKEDAPVDLSRFFDPRVIERLQKMEPKGGEARSVAILAARLDGYRSFCEAHSAQEVQGVLTREFEVVIPSIVERGGVVNELFQDCVLALFGAPFPLPLDEAVGKAFEAAKAILERAAAARPALSLRVGLHAGEAFVGLVGAKQRHSYTAVGHATNLALALAEKAPSLDASLLASDDLVQRLSERPVGLASAGTLSLPDLARPVAAWKLVRSSPG